MCTTLSWKRLEVRTSNGGVQLEILGTRSDDSIIKVVGDVNSANCAADLINYLEELRNPKKEELDK